MARLARGELQLGRTLDDTGRVQLGLTVDRDGRQRLVEVHWTDASVLDPPSWVHRVIGRIGVANRHVSELVDIVDVDHRVALLMEPLDGESLELSLKDGPLPPRAALELAAALATGLADLHAAADLFGALLGAVHGAVVPGLVGMARDRVGLVGHEQTAGLSPAALAPERLSAGPSPATDVFGLGVVLHRAWTGEQLVGDQEAYKHLASRADLWDRWVASRVAAMPEPSHELSALLQRMLAWHAADRPTAEDAATALQSLARAASGPPLTAWAGSRAWPPEVDRSAVHGKVIAARSLADEPNDPGTIWLAPQPIQAVQRPSVPPPAPPRRAADDDIQLEAPRAPIRGAGTDIIQTLPAAARPAPAKPTKSAAVSPLSNAITVDRPPPRAPIAVSLPRPNTLEDAVPKPPALPPGLAVHKAPPTRPPPDEPDDTKEGDEALMAFAGFLLVAILVVGTALAAWNGRLPTWADRAMRESRVADFFPTRAAAPPPPPPAPSAAAEAPSSERRAPPPPPARNDAPPSVDVLAATAPKDTSPTGHLAVRSLDLGCSVSLDGQPLGFAPVERDVPAGPHHLTWHFVNDRKVEQDVVVGAGGSAAWCASGKKVRAGAEVCGP